jgi:hypothetical protein
LVSQSPIEQLLVTAKRRFLLQTVTAQASLALSLAMVVLSILLVVGTQILDWYWPVLVFAGALGVGVWRTRNRKPEPYNVLQRVDARAELHDSISTAYYYRHIAPEGRGDADILAAQANRAEDLARGIDVEHAVPFRLPAAAYAAIFTVVVAVTLFGIRYGVHRSLDLSPPVSEALMDFFRPSTEMEEAWEQAEALAAEQLAEDSVPPGQEENKFDDDADSRLTAMEAPEGDELAPNSDLLPNDSNLDELSEGQSPGDNTFDGDSLPPPDGAESADQGEQSSDPPFPQEDSDLLRKMQDAFANLMNKLNVPPKAGKTKRFPSEESEGTESQEQAQGEEPAEGEQQGDGSPSPSADGEQTQEGAQQAKAGEGQGEAKEGSQPGEQSSQSSAGQQDGLKEIKAAEQLEAMGKLEEILGERAENIKGEIMVEVSSGPQRLQTEYSDTNATHRSAGTEIHRDEVPLELQPYVQRYFEEIRKADRNASQ